MTQQIPKDIAEDSLVPIIVGVTGHRKVDGVMITEDKISNEQKNEIKKVFKELDSKYPNTPIVILSPLTEGADRLVAKLALDTKRRKGVSISLICPLPMPKQEYIKDFATPESKREFESLLKRSSASFDLPLVDGNTLESIESRTNKPRKKQYEQAGKYIARHSHILIALWDGKDKPHDEGMGGTSQIARMRHEGMIGPRRRFDEIDNVPIYHFLITTKEKKNGAKEIEIHPRREIFPGTDLYTPGAITVENKGVSRQKAESFHRVLDRMEMFNSDVKSMSDKRKKEIEKNKAYVIPCEESADLTEMSRRVFHHYGVADTLAIRFQRRSDKTLLWLAIILLVSLFCFEIYAHLVHHPLLLLGYPLGVGLFAFINISVYERVQSKYLDYRALAEGLRVQFFWILSSHPEEVVEFYLRKQQSELDWIKYAIRSFNMPFSVKEFKEKREMGTISLELIRKQLKSVLQHWVIDQAKYSIYKGQYLEVQLKARHILRNYLVLFCMFASILLFILQSNLEHSDVLKQVDHYLIVAIAMAVAVRDYLEKMGSSAQAKRYFRVTGIFHRAYTDLDELLNKHKLKEARELISELGREALEENADWLIIRRERKIEVPTG